MSGTERLPVPELSRAVLIGTSDYRYADLLPTLPAVRNNLTDLLVALTAPDTGILTRQRCTTIDTPDSPDSLLHRLHAVADQAEDLLVVYYAGHGVLHETKDDVLYLTVRHTDPNRPAGNAVPFDWVREAIEQSPARTKLLILDCCYSGTAIGAMSGGTINPRDIEVGGTCVLTSSPRDTISHSPLGEAHTAFTGELIRLLLNGSPIEGEPLTVQALYRGLRAALANRRLPLPKMRTTDTSADLVLRRAPEANPPRTTPPTPPPTQRTTPRPEPEPELPSEPEREPQPKPKQTPEPDRAAGAGSSGAREYGGYVPPPPPPAGKQPVPSWFRYASAVLWVLVVTGFAMSVGGLIGMAAGGDDKLLNEDRSLATNGGITFVVCGVLLIMLRAWRARYAARPAPRWLATLANSWSLATLMVFSLLVSISVATTGRVSPTTGSQLANTVGSTIAFGCAALACAVALLRRTLR